MPCRLRAPDSTSPVRPPNCENPALRGPIINVRSCEGRAWRDLGGALVFSFFAWKLPPIPAPFPLKKHIVARYGTPAYRARSYNIWHPFGRGERRAVPCNGGCRAGKLCSRVHTLRISLRGPTSGFASAGRSYLKSIDSGVVWASLCSDLLPPAVQ